MSLILDKVSYVYGAGTAYETWALKNINLKIDDGEFIGIIGHTGSGKSTLIQHFNGLIKATSGGIYYNGEDIYDDDYDLKALRSKVGLVFQYPEHQLFETTIFDDVCFGPMNQGLSKNEAGLRAFEALKKVLALVQNKYDFIILDCPPAISMITANAFVASQNIIIPSECRTYSFLAMMDLKQSINEIKESLNPDLKVLGILLVKYDKRTTLTKQMQDMIIDFSEQLHTTVYNTTIRNGIAVEESALNQVPLCDYVRKNNNKPYIDYRGFVTETLKRLEMK